MAAVMGAPAGARAAAVAVILTGGQSRRMGRDKAWEEIAGRPCVERVWTACRAAIAEVEFQGALPGLREAFPDTAVWPDARPGLGPLAGLASALARRRGRSVLLVACDMPFVSPQVLGDLLAAQAGVDWAVPVHAGRMHPLCAVYGPAVLPAAEGLLEQGRRSMHGLIEDPRLVGRAVAPIPAWGDPERALLNVNEPEDLARARALAGSGPPLTPPPPPLGR